MAALARWGAAPENKALLIMPIISSEDNVYLSARNIQNLKLIAADQLNVYDLLHADKIVITASALAKIQEVYSA